MGRKTREQTRGTEKAAIRTKLNQICLVGKLRQIYMERLHAACSLPNQLDPDVMEIVANIIAELKPRLIASHRAWRRLHKGHRKKAGRKRTNLGNI